MARARWGKGRLNIPRWKIICLGNEYFRGGEEIFGEGGVCTVEGGWGYCKVGMGGVGFVVMWERGGCSSQEF